MQPISTTFTRAATGRAETGHGVSVFWLMVFAIAILDDADRREKQRRRKRQAHAQPKTRPPGRVHANGRDRRGGEDLPACRFPAP